MKKEDAEEFTQSLGQIVGGSWRQIALAKRLGVPQALDLSVDEWVNKRLGGYVKMNVEDRRRAVAELSANGESTRAIADTLGVGSTTIHRDLAVPNGTKSPEYPQDIVPKGTPLDAVAALAVDPMATSTAATAHVSNNGGENEWYTPPAFIVAARSVMGSIDLDPASSEIANKTVGADTFYTAAQDGLKQPWRGAVWMNPPYAQPLIADFCEAITAKFEAGDITQACVLVNNATETAWFQRMLEQASAVCLIKSRVRFLDQNGNPGAPLQGQAALYFGDCGESFAEHFHSFGKVLRT